MNQEKLVCSWIAKDGTSDTGRFSIGIFKSRKYDVNKQPNTQGIGWLVGRTSHYRYNVMHILAVILSKTCHFFFICQNIFIRVIWFGRNMSSYNVFEYISCILIINENTNLTLVKTTLLTGQGWVTVLVSLPTNASHDVRTMLYLY